MKKLILAICLLPLFVKAQTVVTISTADSSKIQRTTGTTNAELILMNGTRSTTGGFLWNRWNGRTQFRIPIVGDITGLQDSLTNKYSKSNADVRFSPLAGSTSITTLGTITTGSFPAGNLTGTSLPAGIVSTAITTVGALASGSLASGFTPVTNALLANSSVTIGSTAISLGSTSTTLAGLSSVTSAVYDANTSASRVITIAEPTAGIPSIRSLNETKAQLRSLGVDGNVVSLRTGASGGTTVTDGLVINATQALQLPAYTTPGVLANDASGNITSYTVTSGTHTPTATLSSNLTTFTANEGTYSRINNVVTYSGSFSVNITAANVNCVMTLSIPVASNFTAQSDANGTMDVFTTGFAYPLVEASAASDAIHFNWQQNSTGTSKVSFTLQYKIK